MKMLCQNTLTGLVPLYGSDMDAKRRLRLGEEYEVTIKRPRNYRFHKLFFALLNIGWENSKADMPFDVYRKWVTMRAGFYKVYHTGKGELYEADSISFGNMNEDAFHEVYNRVLDVIIKDLDITAEDVQSAISSFL